MENDIVGKGAMEKKLTRGATPYFALVFADNTNKFQALVICLDATLILRIRARQDQHIGLSESQRSVSALDGTSLCGRAFSGEMNRDPAPKTLDDRNRDAPLGKNQDPPEPYLKGAEREWLLPF